VSVVPLLIEVVSGGGVDIDADGRVLLPPAMVEVAREAARAAAEWAQETGNRSPIDVVIQRNEAHTHATVMLSVASLSDAAAFDPTMDVAPLQPPLGSRFRYATPLAKLERMIDDNMAELPGLGSMPAHEKSRLKDELRRLDVPLASKDAPPHEGASFIEHPEAVLTLRFRPDAQLDRINASWRPIGNPEARDALCKQVLEWHRVGVLRPVLQGEARCVSLPVVVPKVGNDGKKTGWRVAIDTRRLNEQLEPDRYSPMPRLEVVRRISQRAALVSTFDCAALFNQFRVAPQHQRYLVVQTGPGAFGTLVGAPFGVSQMPGVAQHWMHEHMVAGDPDLLVYIDDLVMVHADGCTWRAVVDQLLALFKRAKDLHVRLQVDKFQLWTAAPVVVGYQLDCTTKSFKPNPAKIDILLEMQYPRTNKTMDRALNMVAAWAHALPGVQLITQRLRAEVRYGARLERSEAGETAWAELKALLVAPTSMQALREEERVFVWTDGCMSGLGWCVTQFRDGKHWLVAAGGRRTLPFERRLSTPELEALALRQAFTDAADVLVYAPGGVTWYTDSQAVALARGQKSEVKSRAVRQFIIELMAREFGSVQIKRIEGKMNSLADTISRQWEEDETTAEVLMVKDDEDSEVAEEPEPATPELVVLDEEQQVPVVVQSASAGPQSLDKGTATSTEVAPTAPYSEVQVEAVQAALEASLEGARRRDAEQRAWAFAQATDDSPMMRGLRNVQRGTFVSQKKLRDLVVRPDELGRLFVVQKNGMLETRRLVVPSKMLPKVLVTLHEAIGHKGAETLLVAFNERFFSTDARAAAVEVVAACRPCAQVDGRRPDERQGTDPTAWQRFERVAFDVFEVRGAGSTQYGLCIVDVTTGVFEVVPMQTHQAHDVVRALEDGWLRRWPAPRVWSSDNAAELVGVEVEDLERRYNIARESTANRNPRGNGVVERQIGLFKVAVRKLTPLGGDWTRYVSQARWALMCAASATRARLAPIELATGVKPMLGGSVWQKQMPVAGGEKALTSDEVVQTSAQEARAQLAHLEKVANEARLQRNQKASDSTLKKATGASGRQWKVGDVAWYESEPYKNATKFDSLIKRSKLVRVVAVDNKRWRVRLVDWETSLPHAGFVPFRLITEAQNVTKAAAQVTHGHGQRDGGPLAVPTDFGIIINVTETPTGRVVVLAEAGEDGQPDLSKPVQQVEAKLLPAGVVQAAWKAKHLLHAPKQIKAQVQRDQVKQGKSGQGQAKARVP
jgi:RNase H-like domain found in reverse transcriptase